jgi:hypothetical protein
VNTIQWFLLGEVITYVIAAAIHSGALVGGYEHGRARIAEAVIAIVLLGALVSTLVRPRWTRPAGLAAQGFAILATFVGLFTIAVGVGPRTVPDIVYHVAIVAVLFVGLRVAARKQA